MKRLLAPALLALCICGAAQAQVLVTPNTEVPPNGVLLPNGAFVPNAGFVPSNQFVPNGFVGNGFFTNGFVPSNTFFYGSGYYPYGGGVYDLTPRYNGNYGGGFGRIGGGLPIIGLNTPPLQPGPYRRIAIRNGGSGSGYDVRSQQAADENTAAVVKTDPDEVKLAVRLENIMENRPLIEGTVVGISDDGVMVRCEVNGDMRTERFPLGQVVSFQGGRLASAAKLRSDLQPGDRVLVPQPVVKKATQSVAGSRQVTPAKTVKKPAKSSLKSKAKTSTNKPRSSY